MPAFYESHILIHSIVLLLLLELLVFTLYNILKYGKYCIHSQSNFFDVFLEKLTYACKNRSSIEPF